MRAPEFVAVGHVTLDRFDAATRPGGAALFAAVTACRLGLRAALFTSHGPDFPVDTLPTRLEILSLDAPATTVFEHRRTDAGRALRLRSRARPLSALDVPADWREASLVLLAPVLDEVDTGFLEAFPEATLGAAAQGWLRAVEPDGAVVARAWTPPPGLLERLQVLFVSAEDVHGQEAAMVRWVERLPLAVVTAGRSGALLYVNGERYEIRARPAREVDPTGAGDVFAAAFLIHYHRTGDPWEAAAAATCAASLSVEAEGWHGIPDEATLARALGAYHATA